MYFTGIDMGSTCTKLIVLDEGGAIAYKKVVPTGWNCVETAKGLIDELAKEGFAREDMLIVSTGYGRQAIPFADKKVTEISCHGRGAYYLFNDDAFTLIDIGGQDTKIIETERGTVRNFIMNDKCSAGTGRFLEIMAGVLGVGLNEMCELGRESKNHVSISSMCTVFAESEVVSLIGRGTDKADIAYGIVESIATKVKGQMGQAWRRRQGIPYRRAVRNAFCYRHAEPKAWDGGYKRAACALRGRDRRGNVRAGYFCKKT